MRNNIVHIGADELTYEIREIVDVAKKLEILGMQISWENIGDPVAKGEKIPNWIKDEIKKAIDQDQSFAYCPTKGLPEAREFLAQKCNQRGGAQITAEDIVFFNGLGDAISKIYTYLRHSARVLGPSPAYSTHSSAEAAHAGSDHLTYDLLPQNNWLPDIEDIKNKVKYNPSISAILIINPDNPTGMVYPKETLKEIVKIAKEYDLFLICDEIYSNIVYNDQDITPLSTIIEDVPSIAMRGISKELPWPGARCGWIEVYNKNKDENFARYIKTLVDAKMLEVCSTTLPQKVLPQIMSDDRYEKYLQSRNTEYAKRAEIADNILKKIPQITAPKPTGAYYLSVVFNKDVLNDTQKLNIENKKIQEYLENELLNKKISNDKRFAYYLMASTGICIVPLSGFNCSLEGFRITLLENNDEKFKWIFETVGEKIKEYLK